MKIIPNTNMKLVPKGRPCKLIDLPDGSLFIFEDIIGFKSEYGTNQGAVQAFILGTGEMFWGDAEDGFAQRNLIVQPLAVIYHKYIGAKTNLTKED